MKKTSCLIAIMLLITAISFAQNNGTIRLTRGQKYIVDNKITTSSTSETQGQTVETSAHVTTTYNLEVTDVADNYQMNNKIASIKMNVDMMGQSMNFDSDNQDDMNGELGSEVKGIIGQPQNVVMSKTGNIIPRAADSTTPADPSPQASMMMKQLGDPQLNGYGAKFAFMAIPQKARAGISWQDSTSVEGVKTVTNYTIKEIKADTATVEISGTEDRDTKVQMQQMEVETKTKGTFTGETTVSISSGVIVKNSTTLEAKGIITAMGQDIPTTIKATTENIITAQ